MRTLEGLAVVITGSGGGLGRAYALAAASAGAMVVVGDVDADAARRTAHDIVSAGGAAIVVAGSVSDPRTAETLVDRCLTEFGRIDGLVNNAAILSPGDVVAQTPEIVEATVATNVLGVIHCGTAALRVMVAAGRGSIVNVVSGAMQGLAHLALYGGTKGAVMGLTYGWALEVQGTGVRVNALSPLAATGMSMGATDPAVVGGRPELIAPAVVHLLGPRSAGLHGQIVRFDGQRLGLVAPPHLLATSGARDGWDAAMIADAFDAGLGEFRQPVGLAAAPAPIELDPLP